MNQVRRLLPLSLFLSLLVPLASASVEEEAITTASLIEELVDLERLTRLPDPPYRTVQFSSTDRRSTAPGEPGWFSNSDGFGGEPIPGFEEVLREPGEDGVGLYLLCDIEGPGAIVRGWSAKMDGTLEVTLDEAPEPIFRGGGYDFLARRTRLFLEEAGVELDTRDALMQQDADYFPVPFAKRLRITWEGKISKLHFYHLEVRRYEPGVRVETFPGGTALAELKPRLESVVQRLTAPEPIATTKRRAFDWNLNARVVDRTPFCYRGEAGAITEFTVKLEAENLEAALRGVLLKIAFDGSRRPEVLAPVGDFFASGIGVNPYDSLPFSVKPDGTMHCRWPMPYERSFTVSFHNPTDQPVRAIGSIAIIDRPWDERSLHFHARWRNDRAIDLAGKDPIDLTFLRASGAGRLVGITSILLNPSPCPTPSGNWWGEGDEKIYVDGEVYPSFLGTGSEDYYNYSWSRPDLFDHPFCGQPLDSGPGNSGHVVNFRWHVIDDVPYRESLLFLMELWHHRVIFPIDYARGAYWYARPGGDDDGPEPTHHDVVVPELPRWEPQAIRGSANSIFLHLEDCVVVREGTIERIDEPLASRGRLLHWDAEAGESLEIPFTVAGTGEYGVNLIARHRPDGATIGVLLDGELLPLHSTGGSEACMRGDREIPLRTQYVPRLLSLGFAARELEAGEHRLTLECVEDGDLAFDYLWIKTHRLAPVSRPGAIEAETLEVAPSDPAIEWEAQGMQNVWSGSGHLWVQATAEGQHVDLTIPLSEPGSYRVKLHLTESWDYAILEFLIGDRKVGGPVDTYRANLGLAPVVDLGTHDLQESFVLRVRTVGAHPDTKPPHYYFGIDCIVLDPIDEERP
jgi:hypothetical protein